MTKTVQIFKSKAIFLLLFLSLVYSLGYLYGEVREGLNYKVVVFFSIAFLIFLFDLIQKKKIRFFSQGRAGELQFILFASSFFLITIFRDGLVGTYLFSVILTFIAVLVLIQFLYRIPLQDALHLFLVAMFILLLINFYAHYLKNPTFDIVTQNRSMHSRFSGVFGGGLAAALAGLSAIFPVVIYFVSKKKNVVFLILNILLSWLALWLADNRTSMFACLFIYVIIFLYLSKQSLLFKILFVTVVSSIFFLARYYLKNTVGGEGIENDADLRFALWGVGVEQLSNNLFLGSGKSNPFLSNWSALSLFPEIADPHNSYLYYILKNGIVVSAFFFIYLISTLLAAYNRLKSTKYSLFLVIPLYWLIISITGGDYFNFSFNFSSVVFGISIFGFINHPAILHNHSLQIDPRVLYKLLSNARNN